MTVIEFARQNVKSGQKRHITFCLVNASQVSNFCWDDHWKSRDLEVVTMVTGPTIVDTSISRRRCHPGNRPACELLAWWWWMQKHRRWMCWMPARIHNNIQIITLCRKLTKKCASTRQCVYSNIQFSGKFLYNYIKQLFWGIWFLCVVFLRSMDILQIIQQPQNNQKIQHYLLYTWKPSRVDEQLISAET